MRSGFETYASFYKSHADMMQALFTTVDTLRDFQDEDSQVSKVIERHGEKLMKIDDLCNYVKDVNPKLDYINRDHIIELFFKDRERRIFIVDGDYVQYRSVQYVQPPEQLYFGTVKNLAEKMVQKGLKSRTKGFIKLQDSPEKANEHAKQFATREGDITVAIKVNALDAFKEGTKFSTHNTGEYVVVRIDKRHLKDVIEFEAAENTAEDIDEDN